MIVLLVLSEPLFVTSYTWSITFVISTQLDPQTLTTSSLILIQNQVAPIQIREWRTNLDQIFIILIANFIIMRTSSFYRIAVARHEVQRGSIIIMSSKSETIASVSLGFLNFQYRYYFYFYYLLLRIFYFNILYFNVLLCHSENKWTQIVTRLCTTKVTCGAFSC